MGEENGCWRRDRPVEVLQTVFTATSTTGSKEGTTGSYIPTSGGKRPAVQASTYSAAAPRYGNQPSYSAQKRPYAAPPSSYPAAKAPRYGGYSGGQGGGYRR